MGYRILYDDRIGKYEVKPYHPGRCWLVLAVVLLVTLTIWQDGADLIREALIPGDNTQTVTALKKLTEGLQEGKGLREAVTAFCMDVIHGSVPAH